jgi:glycosyltransferase involved in cell wall biosynthesis
MKLAIFHPSFGDVGGAEVLALSEARALRACGVDARIVTGEFDAHQWSEQAGDVPVDCFRSRTFADALTWKGVTKLRMRARRAARVLQDGGVDVVIAHNYPCNAMLGAMDLDAVRLWQANEPSRSLYLKDSRPVLTARVAATGANAPDYVTREFAGRLGKWERRLARGGELGARRQFDAAMTAKLDGIYAISAYSRDNARRIYGRCSDTVVYPAVRPLAVAPGGRRGIDAGALQVVAQTRLHPEKNVDTVIEGFAMYARRHVGAHLHVAGTGPDLPRLTALAERTAPGLVTFHGFVDAETLESLMAACDVFALLPVDEPFGMVFTEAMTRGLLCIGPDHGGPLEILEEGQQGWAVDAFAAEQLAAALDEASALANGEADVRRASALESVKARFSTDAMVSSLRAVLREAGLSL